MVKPYPYFVIHMPPPQYHFKKFKIVKCTTYFKCEPFYSILRNFKLTLQCHENIKLRKHLHNLLFSWFIVREYEKIKLHLSHLLELFDSTPKLAKELFLVLGHVYTKFCSNTSRSSYLPY